MDRLSGKIALITGAGRGIGRALAKRFAAEGAKVAVLSLTPANIDRTVGEIQDAGGTALGVQCDVNQTEQIAASVAKVAEAFGTIDILVNNAFEYSSTMGSVLETTEDQLKRQFQSGPIAMLRFMQECYPYLQRKGGRVINFGSSVGVQSTPGIVPYGMAKEAIRSLTRAAAREWGAKAITVNCICPIAATDSYDTSVNSEKLNWTLNLPIPRVGSPENDIAPVALFLASDEASYITGYSFMADGGFMIDAAR